MKRGFTLIELLIVVAIIAILAAIAVPNFLEAQTRSKVARVKSDMRSLNTAIEAYMTDWNKVPPQSVSADSLADTPFGFIRGDKGEKGTGTLTRAITTPVAYMTSFMLMDPFPNNDVNVDIDQRLYTYQAYQWKWLQVPVSPSQFDFKADNEQEVGNQRLTGVQFREIYGNYMLLSVGPDRTFYNRKPTGSAPFPVSMPYDPSNGTVSFGNIIRSQKQPDQKAFIPL